MGVFQVPGVPGVPGILRVLQVKWALLVPPEGLQGSHGSTQVAWVSTGPFGSSQVSTGLYESPLVPLVQTVPLV